jgi:hypothetical protein
MADKIVDDAAYDESVAPIQYDITSFGADYDVEGLVRRLQRGDVLVPTFQRGYVWSIKEASRFIESLLLGLPVPGIFLAREPDSNRLLVIDGQQRLRTLQFFYEGTFNAKDEETSRRVFRLQKVQKKFEGKTLKSLDESDRIKLQDSIIHATIIKQESPEDDNTSIYHVFERLNNGGQKLKPQQIRVAIYHGTFINLIKSLNDHANWRSIFGRKDSDLKDQELILRFFALYYDSETYRQPMKEFLNVFLKRHRNLEEPLRNECESLFKRTIDVLWESLGKKAFRPERALNTAVYDSITVGLARRIAKGGEPDRDKVEAAYNSLLQNERYLAAASRATANERAVEARLTEATAAFSHV